MCASVCTCTFALVLLIVVARVCILELTYVVLRVAIVLAREPVNALALGSDPALVLVSEPTCALALHLAIVRVSVSRPVLVRSCTCKCT